jgi:hypothetical protein
MFAKEAAKTIPANRRASAFTLAEVVVALGILALVFGGILTANTQLTKRSEWTGQSLAAQAMAIQQLEQARSAVWDPSAAKNEMTNLNLVVWTYNMATGVGTGYSWTNLDLPVSGTNCIRATNFVTLTQLTNVTGLAGVKLQMLQVDTVWPFLAFGLNRLYTNTVVTYFAPDDMNASNL